MAPLGIGSGTAPDFSDPIGLLEACHGRILHHCDTLEKLVAHLREHGPDEEARTAAARVRHYFDTAGRHHHRDEEEDLFPVLRERDATLAALIDDLTAQHAHMDRFWAALADALADLRDPVDTEAFAAIVDDFVTAYREHVERENTHLLPRARTLLGEADKRALGRAMARRRGVDL